MTNIEIEVWIPVDVALRAGKGQHGSATVALSGELLSKLSDEERGALAEMYSNRRLVQHPGGAAELLTLESADTAAESTLIALRAAIAKYQTARDEFIASTVAAIDAGEAFSLSGFDASTAVELLRRIDPKHPALARFEQQRRAKIEARRQEWLSNPETRKRAHGRARGELLAPEYCGADPEVRAVIDADNRARQEQLAREAAEEAEREAKEKAEREATEAAAKAERDRVTAALREFALTIPELAPATEDGYEVSGGVLDVIAARVAALAPKPPAASTAILSSGSDAWKDTEEEDRRAPRAELVHAQRAFAAACAKLSLPEGVTVRVFPVQRVTVKRRDEYGDVSTTKRTALFALVETKSHGDRAVYAYVE